LIVICPRPFHTLHNLLLLKTMNIEIEARFLDIDKQKLIERLVSLGAKNQKEIILKEIIFYDKANTWSDEGRFVRLRSSGDQTLLTYKQNKAQTIDSAREVEFNVPDVDLATQFLESIGLASFRHQEKKRHTFILNDVTVDIDTWPKVPTYVELEGPSEIAIKAAARLLDFDWSDAVFDDARAIIEKRYAIPVGSLRWFTFDRYE
jgi:adenylate cyclase, class 2